MSRQTHDRTRDHMGVEPPSAIVLDVDIPPFHAGDSLVDVIEALVAALRTIGLIVTPFPLDAVIQKTQSGSFTLDADLERGWKLDAVIFRTQAASLTLDAVIVRSFTLDADIEFGFRLDAAIVV